MLSSVIAFQRFLWADLVDSCWDIILQNLANDEKKLLRLVCQGWRKDVSKGMRRIQLLNSDLVHLQDLAVKFPNVSEVVLIDDSSAAVKLMFDRLCQQAGGLLHHRNDVNKEGGSSGLPTTVHTSSHIPQGCGEISTISSYLGKAWKHIHRIELRSFVLDNSLEDLKQACGSRVTGLSLQHCRFGTLQSQRDNKDLLQMRRLQAGQALTPPSSISSLCLSPFKDMTSLDVDCIPLWKTGCAQVRGHNKEFQVEGLDQLRSLQNLRVRLYGLQIHNVAKEVVKLCNLQSLDVDLHCPGDPLRLDELLFMYEEQSIMLWSKLRRIAIKGHQFSHDRHFRLLALLPMLESVSLVNAPGDLSALSQSQPAWTWAGGLMPPEQIAQHAHNLPADDIMQQQGQNLIDSRQHSVSDDNLNVVTDYGLTALIRHPLKKLSLSSPSIPAITSCCPLVTYTGFTSLSLSGLSCVDDACIYNLASIQSLKTLVLSGCTSISNIGLGFIARNAPLLETLDISGCDVHVSDVGLAKLSTLKRLREFCTAFNSRVTDNGVKALISGAAGKGLKKLDLSGCHQLSNQVLPWLGSEVHGLLELNVRWCPRINQRGLAEFLPCLQNLIELKWRTTEEDVFLLIKSQCCQKTRQPSVCASGVMKIQAAKACISHRLSAWWLV